MTTVLLVGGSSDIGTAIVARLVKPEDTAVLVGRPSPRRDRVVNRLSSQGVTVDAVDADCTDLTGFVETLARALDHHRVDIAVVAQGVLADQAAVEAEPAWVLDMAAVNYTSAMAAGLLLARHMAAPSDRRGGAIVALSSVAAVRPRVGNYVYGSTKAGLDAFFRGLGERLTHSGVRVLVVRPGFVTSAMTAGRPPAPFATTPGAVADAVADALARPRPPSVVWVPRPLAVVGTVLRVLPTAVLRRLPEERPSRPRRRARSDVSTPSGSSR